MRLLTRLCRALVAALLLNIILLSAAQVTFAQAQPGELIISEVRWRGPRGILDEFVEVYNASGRAINVATADGSPGYALVASDGVARCVIPNGTVIPNRGHFLCVNNTPDVGYSLASYPAGHGTTATGDAFFVLDLPEPDPDGAGPSPPYQAGVALFRTTLPLNFTLANRLDAVGSRGEPNPLYREGAGLPNLIGRSINYSWYRNLSSGRPQDTGDNAADFVFVSPDGEDAGAGRQLGAPGPENLSSPRMTELADTPVELFSPCMDRSLAPNRERYTDPYVDTLTPTTTYDSGTLTVRRRLINNTGGPITRLRFRVITLTTFPTTTTADLRLLTSPDAVVGDPCTAGFNVVRGLKLEQAAITQPNGGALNSTVSVDAVTLADPLPATDDPATPERENVVDVQFVLGVVAGGTFRFFIVIEALP
ncbi:MAG TPA: hypothetical protein VGX48_22895 [Pyrinomonadaceae bacterium]|jgi:hypothetical protein|nr:hypothetical protein [Pyrinomonadaceae bacterium]